MESIVELTLEELSQVAGGTHIAAGTDGPALGASSGNAVVVLATAIVSAVISLLP